MHYWLPDNMSSMYNDIFGSSNGLFNNLKPKYKRHSSYDKHVFILNSFFKVYQDLNSSHQTLSYSK